MRCSRVRSRSTAWPTASSATTKAAGGVFDPATLRCAPGAPAIASATRSSRRCARCIRRTIPTSCSPTACATIPAGASAARAASGGGPVGGCVSWQTGTAPQALPAGPASSRAWLYGSGAIQWFYLRDGNADPRGFKPSAHAAQVARVSALMDSTDPDLAAFAGARRQAGRAASTWPTTRRARTPASPTGRASSSASARAQVDDVPAPLRDPGRRPCRHRRADDGRHARRARRLGRDAARRRATWCRCRCRTSRRTRRRRGGRCAAIRRSRATSARATSRRRPRSSAPREAAADAEDQGRIDSALTCRASAVTRWDERERGIVTPSSRAVF